MAERKERALQSLPLTAIEAVRGMLVHFDRFGEGDIARVSDALLADDSRSVGASVASLGDRQGAAVNDPFLTRIFLDYGRNALDDTNSDRENRRNMVCEGIKGALKELASRKFSEVASLNGEEGTSYMLTAMGRGIASQFGREAGEQLQENKEKLRIQFENVSPIPNPFPSREEINNQSGQSTIQEDRLKERIGRSNERFLREVKQFIQEHPDEPIRIRYIAAKAGFTNAMAIMVYERNREEWGFPPLPGSGASPENESLTHEQKGIKDRSKIVILPDDEMLIHNAHKGPVYGLQIVSEDMIISLGQDTTLRVWGKHGEAIAGVAVKNLGTAVGFVAVHEKVIAPVRKGRENGVCMWDLKTGEVVRDIFHNKLITGIGVLPDDTIVTGSNDKTIGIWNCETVNLVRKIAVPNPVENLVILGDGTILIRERTGNYASSFSVWDPDSTEKLGTFTSEKSTGGKMVVLPDNTLILSNIDLTMSAVDPYSGKVINTTEYRPKQGIVAKGMIPLGESSVLTSDIYGDFELWNIHTNFVDTVDFGNIIGFSLAALPDGRIAIGDRNGGIHIRHIQ